MVLQSPTWSPSAECRREFFLHMISLSLYLLEIWIPATQSVVHGPAGQRHLGAN